MYIKNYNIMINRFLQLIILLFALMGTAEAQVSTMYAMPVGASSGGGLYVALGELFSGSVTGSGYTVSAGIAQAQLEREEYVESVAFGEGYEGHGFSYPATTPVGTYSGKIYTPYGGSYKYDLLKTLKLRVLGPFSCGELVYDGDHNPYPTLEVAGYCWTQTNLRAQHYDDAAGTSIAKALVYESDAFPDAVENESVYGRLYTWYSAVNVPEGSTAAPVTDADGFVQGICPSGWHIPTIVEMNALEALAAEDIRSTERWITPNSNTNSTGFSELPAGLYNAGNDSFERLLLDTYLWSTAVPTPDAATTLSTVYYCNTPLPTALNANDAVSVRCVKNS